MSWYFVDGNAKAPVPAGAFAKILVSETCNSSLQAVAVVRQDRIKVVQPGSHPDHTRCLVGFRLLTEYECGRALTAIEWVARAQKPIVEVGGRPIKDCDLVALSHDLDTCITQSGESVRAFVIPDSVPGFCCYGFYRYPWAIRALLSISRKNKSRLLRSWDSLWIRGLVFGYSPDAVQRFMSCASPARVATMRRDHRTIRRVEIYDPLGSLVRARSKSNGRCQKSG